MSRPVRILEILPTSTPGGESRHVWDLVRHLPRDEFEPIVAAPRDGMLFERFRDLGARVAELPVSPPGGRHFLLTTRLISRLRIDVVHTHGKGPGVFGRLAARWCGVPAIHTFHGLDVGVSSRSGRRLHGVVERALCRSCQRIINVSASQHAEALAHRLFRAEQGVMIAGGVDVDDMQRRAGRSTIRRQTLGLTAEDLVIGHVGRFEPTKRIELLVATVSRLKQSIPRSVLVLVGGGSDEERIRRLVFETGMNRHVLFTGSLPNAAQMYSVFDVYVSASQKEGLRLSLIEAMAAGLPVVATDVPGHRDVVVHGQTGLLVPPGDLDAFGDAIASLVADPARRRAMGHAGRCRVRDEFSVGPMVEATAQVYRQAVASLHRPRSETDGGGPVSVAA